MMDFKTHIKSLLNSTHKTEKVYKSVSFDTFKCTCNIDPEFIYGEIKNPLHMKCIIKNYMLYIKIRNIHQFLHPSYIKLLDDILESDLIVSKLSLDKPTLKINTMGKIYNATLPLFLDSPYCTTTLLKFVDLTNQIEFIDFVKKHIIYTNLDKDLLLASETIKNITQSKFTF